jgi:type IV pilus assembly protein PilV
MLIKRSSIRGFTLLEVLVSVLVLSIGLLGLASLQVAGMQNNHSAYLRTQATLLAYDMADRMRANVTGVTNLKYSHSDPDGTVQANCLTTTGCTSTEMAGHDIYEWYQSLGNQLPGGKGVVCLDASPDDGDGADLGTSGGHGCSGGGDNYAVKIWWTDDRDGGDLKRFAMSFTP